MGHTHLYLACVALAHSNHPKQAVLRVQLACCMQNCATACNLPKPTVLGRSLFMLAWETMAARMGSRHGRLSSYTQLPSCLQLKLQGSTQC